MNKLANCTIVIPTYNERDNISALLTSILTYPQFRVLVVDDGSPDGTGELVRQYMRDEPRIDLIERAGKQGLGTAYIAGFQRALAQGADYIFEMDADFSHDPRYLPALLAQAEQHHDLVIGSRYVRGGGTENWGLIRQLISRGGNIYARMILGLATKDCTGGFRCYRRRVLETLNLKAIRSNGYAFQIEMAYRTQQHGFSIGEIPIIFPDRRVGASKMSKAIVREALFTVWKLRTQTEPINTEAIETDHILTP
jgi:dolichol-phosphate mannosyltransferase